MNNKGLIKLFSILLAIACLFELSFTLATRHVESEAKEYAQGDLEKEENFLDSLNNQKVWFWPYKAWLWSYTYQECKEKEINLGLDLKGGMNVTMEVTVVELVKAMAENNPDTTFNKAIARAQEMQKNSQEDFVTLFGKAFEQIDPNAKLAGIFGTVRGKNEKITFNSTNAEVLDVIRTEAKDAIDRTYQILSTRIDRFGVAQASIQQVGTSGRILIELPGVKEPARVRKLLQGTAKLEFWDTYQNIEAHQYLSEANNRLKALKKAEKVMEDSLSGIIGNVAVQNAIADTGAENLKDSSEFSFLNKTGDSLSAAANGDTAAAAKEDNPLFSLLYPNIYQDEKGQYMLGPGPAVGRCLARDTAAVNAMLNKKEVQMVLPPNLKLLWTAKAEEGNNGEILTLVAIKTKGSDNRAPLEGDAVTDARPDFGQNNEVEISMSMNAEGANKWKLMTAAASKEDPKRSIAVVLDNYVYSYPTVEGEIPNGRTSIHGNFTLNEAKDLANVLKAGKLPAPARIVEEAVVGPSLGAQAINDGLRSFAIALALIIIFMVFFYNNAGWIANVALFVNLFFLIGVLASFGAVLTLPGILGIVLTMGMAVDANVLINERIREELASGIGLRTSIEKGYKRALTAIIDANATHLITGTILAVFGSGPVQGFAITLIIGVITSFITSVFITRIIILWLLDNKVNLQFSTKLTKGFLKNLNIKFVEQRRVFYGIFATFIIAGVISFAIRGFNYGIDFSGGRSYVVSFANSVSPQEAQDALKVTFDEVPQVKVYGANNQLKITTNYLIEDKSAEADAKVDDALKSGLSKFSSATIESSQKVGPTVADDLKWSAFLSVFCALIAIFLYVALRFRNWRFGLGAVFALFHDVLFVLAGYTLLYGRVPFVLEIDKELIAALLTVVGYSINDTVVVFDRIRENAPNFSQLGKSELVPLINKAINDTMSRTVNTALTVILILLTTFLFGGDIVKGFTFALLIGVISGTYSSIAIAIPVVVDLTKEKVGITTTTVNQKKDAVLAK